jgi:hypothetical protein
VVPPASLARGQGEGRRREKPRSESGAPSAPAPGSRALFLPARWDKGPVHSFSALEVGRACGASSPSDPSSADATIAVSPARPLAQHRLCLEQAQASSLPVRRPCYFKNSRKTAHAVCALGAARGQPRELVKQAGATRKHLSASPCVPRFIDRKGGYSGLYLPPKSTMK